jgi:predicted dehydrogenase
VICRSANSALVGIADVRVEQANQLARTSGADGISSWQQLVTCPAIDAVVIATPTGSHFEIATAALKAGKHVLCEKPLAMSVEQASEMVEEAKRRHLVLKTGFNYRHMDHVRTAKELLDRGSLGPLYLLRCCFGHGGRPGYEKEWYNNPALSSGGVALEQGIHVFDLVRYLLDEPTEVLAVTPRFFWQFERSEDNAFCLFRTRRGQIAQIHVSWTQWRNVFHLEIVGRDGYLALEGRDGHYGTQRLTLGRRREDHSRPDEQTYEFGPTDDSWRSEWREFVSAIEEHRDPIGSGFDGLRAQQIVESAYCSAARREWVTIDSIG